jgi:hypothetical protein
MSIFKTIDASRIPANYRATLRIFASFSPDGGGTSIFPSLSTVAKRLGRKRSMVQKHVRWLIANGLMTPAPGYENRDGGWIVDKRCGRATEFVIDTARVKAWTPGTSVPGGSDRAADATPGTSVLGPPGTRVPGPPGTPVPPSPDSSFDNQLTVEERGQRPVHAVENSAAPLAESPSSIPRASMYLGPPNLTRHRAQVAEDVLCDSVWIAWKTWLCMFCGCYLWGPP